MDKMTKEQLIFKLTQTICYPDGTIFDSYIGEQVPRMTPENFGRMCVELCELKAVLIAMLEDGNEG